MRKGQNGGSGGGEVGVGRGGETGTKIKDNNDVYSSQLQLQLEWSNCIRVKKSNHMRINKHKICA